MNEDTGNTDSVHTEDAELDDNQLEVVAGGNIPIVPAITAGAFIKEYAKRTWEAIKED